MKIPFFVDKDLNILLGNQATEALQKENDYNFITQGKGVIRVSEKRWKIAQECEKNHWLKRGINTANDRNDYHLKQFDDYRAIQNLTFDSLLEIGCGPFTNSRLISSICKINSCSLLDPLIDDYLNHPYCAYNKELLFSEKFPFVGKVIRKIIPNVYKYYRTVLSNKVKIVELLNYPAERLDTSRKYDLIVMINVIEHCYDLELILRNILDTTHNNSFFIFEDKFYNYKQVENELKISYDAAHPLKVDRRIIEEYLNDNFETVYKRIQTNSFVFEGEKVVWEDVYFIGARK